MVWKQMSVADICHRCEMAYALEMKGTDVLPVLLEKRDQKVDRHHVTYDQTPGFGLAIQHNIP